ncbi:MAG: hypothetical protein PHW87_06165 [Methanothrix sp.]|nr:hypothetical protein [Methanothrix sp.]
MLIQRRRVEQDRRLPGGLPEGLGCEGWAGAMKTPYRIVQLPGLRPFRIASGR